MFYWVPFHYPEFTCGGVLTGTSGIIQSPDYPYSYPPNVECIWNIKVAEGSRISLNFTDIDIESDEKCITGDYIMVGDTLL